MKKRGGLKSTVKQHKKIPKKNKKQQGRRREEPKKTKKKEKHTPNKKANQKNIPIFDCSSLQSIYPVGGRKSPPGSSGYLTGRRCRAVDRMGGVSGPILEDKKRPHLTFR